MLVRSGFLFIEEGKEIDVKLSENLGVCPQLNYEEVKYENNSWFDIFFWGVDIG